jgi:uncharacterized protein
MIDMFIDLEQIPPEGRGVEACLEAGRLAFETNEFRLKGPVLLTGRIEPIENDAYRLRGRLQATLELDCVRCLEPWELRLGEDFDLVYLPQSANVGPEDEEERELTDEDMAVAFYRAQQIDLRLMIWEQLNLALPMKPLCKEDCRGLCPQCGTNRNVASCQCAPENLDPRLSVLKSLLKS